MKRAKNLENYTIVHSKIVPTAKMLFAKKSYRFSVANCIFKVKNYYMHVRWVGWFDASTNGTKNDATYICSACKYLLVMHPTLARLGFARIQLKLEASWLGSAQLVAILTELGL